MQRRVLRSRLARGLPVIRRLLVRLPALGTVEGARWSATQPRYLAQAFLSL